jgi:hypothetical protein
MPEKRLNTIGSILETLTGVLEIEYLKKQKRDINEYDSVVIQLEDMVRIAKNRSAISKEEGKPARRSDQMNPPSKRGWSVPKKPKSAPK